MGTETRPIDIGTDTLLAIIEFADRAPKSAAERLFWEPTRQGILAAMAQPMQAAVTPPAETEEINANEDAAAGV